VARKDPAGNIKLDQEKSRKKIDGMAATVNAIGGR
jgi:phage terminase large subunit-like protein